MFEKLKQFQQARDLGKLGGDKDLKEYQKKVSEVAVEVMRLMESKGIDTYGKALDVIKTCETTIGRMMYSSKFEEPK